MTKQFNVKRIVISCIVFVMGLMTMLTLCMPLIKVSDPLINSSIIKNSFGFQTSETGFTLLDFSSGAGMEKELAIAVGIYALLQLLLSLSTMTFAVVCIFKFNQNKANKILRGHLIACFIFIFIYMVCGIVFSNVWYKYFTIHNDGSWELHHFESNWETYYKTETYTLAYLGFIFGALLLAAYIVCSVLIKDADAPEAIGNDNNSAQEQSTQASATVQQQNDELTRTNNVVQMLKQYKELLDCGIITQEEFDEKKRKLLD